MGGGKDAPDPPDYRAAAEEQAEASERITREQTYANRPTQNTPWGSLSWDVRSIRDPVSGQMVPAWTQNIELNPAEQQALEYQQQLQGQRSGLAAGMYDRMASEYADPPDWSSYEELYTPDRTIGDYGPMQAAPSPTGMVDLPGSLERAGPDLDPSQRYYGDAEDAIYGQFERRAEPRFEQAAEALDTRLRNQGLRPGDEAYDYAVSQLRQSQDDARLGAQYQATLGAGQEAQRMLGMDAATRGQLFGENQAIGAFDMGRAGQQYGMMSDQFGQQMAGAQFQQSQRGQQLAEDVARFSQDMSRAGFTGQLRQQRIAEEMQRRGYTLNEVNAILTGQQVAMPSMPGFNTAQRSETPQYLSAANMGYQADLDQFSANQALTQGLMSGLSDMGSAYLGGFG